MYISDTVCLLVRHAMHRCVPVRMYSHVRQNQKSWTNAKYLNANLNIVPRPEM
jgi:hypothetical protein